MAQNRTFKPPFSSPKAVERQEIVANYFIQTRLAAVNFFLGIVGVIQVSRIAAYNYNKKGESTTEQLEGATEDIVDSAQGLKKDAIAAVKS